MINTASQVSSVSIQITAIPSVNSSDVGDGIFRILGCGWGMGVGSGGGVVAGDIRCVVWYDVYNTIPANVLAPMVARASGNIALDV